MTLPVLAANLPDELRSERRWVVWKYELRDGKPTKIPFDPVTRQRAKSNDPATWGSWLDVLQHANNGYDGIGFMLAGSDIAVIDLDKCRDPETGGIDGHIETLIDDCASFTEVSPSGTGVHVWCHGTPPDAARRRVGTVEFYSGADNRYVAMTGHRIRKYAMRELDLTALHGKLFPHEEDRDDRASSHNDNPNQLEPSAPARSSSWTPKALIEQAILHATDPERVRLMVAGELAGHPSESEARLSLLNALARVTDEPDAIRAAYEATARRNSKQDHRLLPGEIRKALESRPVLAIGSFGPLGGLAGWPSYPDDELLAKELPEIVSLPVLGQPNVIIRGGSHVVAAGPKSGKTTLLGHAIYEWAAVGETIRYITEEPVRMWQHRLRGRKVTGAVRFTPGYGIEPARLLGMAGDCQESVIVVDTIRPFLRIADENDNAAVGRAVEAWVKMARDSSKTLVLVHHQRKGGEGFDAISGAHALFGTVDQAVLVIRDPSAKTRRRIETIGREVEPQAWLYDYDAMARDVFYVGAPGDVRRDETEERLLRVLDTTWQSRADVVGKLDAPKPSDRTIQRALTALVARGAVSTMGAGSVTAYRLSD